MPRRLTWVVADDEKSATAYATGALPVAEVWFSRWPPFPGAWQMTVAGERAPWSRANYQLAQQAAERIWRDRQAAQHRRR